MTTLALQSVFMAGLLALTVSGADVPTFNDVDGYDVRLERTFKGSVASPLRVVDGMVYFRLETEMRMVDVELGPRDFVERSGFALGMGEPVTVVGIPAMVGKREVILAREVRTAMEVFVIRDRNGRPKWDRGWPVEMDPEHAETDELMCGLPVF